jgi:hypothetical protein
MGLERWLPRVATSEWLPDLVIATEGLALCRISHGQPGCCAVTSVAPPELTFANNDHRCETLRARRRHATPWVSCRVSAGPAAIVCLGGRARVYCVRWWRHDDLCRLDEPLTHRTDNEPLVELRAKRSWLRAHLTGMAASTTKRRMREIERELASRNVDVDAEARSQRSRPALSVVLDPAALSTVNERHTRYEGTDSPPGEVVSRAIGFVLTSNSVGRMFWRQRAASDQPRGGPRQAIGLAQKQSLVLGPRCPWVGGRGACQVGLGCGPLTMGHGPLQLV